jgi:hypothetical protein
MKTITLKLLLALILAGYLPALAQNAEKEQVTVPLSSPKKPGVLRVKLTNGSINVVGYNGKDVVIEASTRGSRARRAESKASEAGGLRRIDATEGFELAATENNNVVVVKTDSYRHTLDLTIKVPEDFSLQIGTVNNGNVTVENVSGELEVNNVNGSITLTQVSGSAVASTVNGSLTASFRKVSAAPMAFSTVNGKVDVTFPNNIKTNLKLKSDQGAIYSDFEMSVEKSPTPTVTSNAGTYRITKDSWTYGKLNGGGAEVMMKSLNGSIYLRKAK